MAIEVLLAQGLVLVFTAALWWIARRDLAARSAAPPDTAKSAETNAEMAELEQLCATLETLVTSLARRLDAVERAVAEPFVPAPPMPAMPSVLPMPSVSPLPSMPLPPAVPVINAAPPDTPPDPRYAPVYALLAAGVSDPAELARRTGLGRGEVDLILSLQSRRAF